MFALHIVSPNGVVYSDDIEKVTIPTEAGELTIHENHTPIVGVLKAGIIRIQKDNNDPITLAVAGGVVEMLPSGKLVLLADSAERAESIDLYRAEKAKKRAEELLSQEQALSDVDMAMLQAKIQKEMARIEVGNNYKKLPNS